MTRVLVTGATGFVGRHAIAPLLAKGYEVHALSRRPGAEPGVTWHQGDVLDPAFVARVAAEVRASHCLHLAWEVGPGYWTAPGNMDWVAATLSLLRAFHQAGGRRFVGAGSCAEYDWSHDHERFAEDVARAPATFYGVAKDATRRMIEAYARETGLSWAWGVMFLSFGPFERPERLVPSVIRALLAGERARTTAGTQPRDFMDSRDQGSAFAALVDGTVEGVVNVASGEPTAVAEVVGLLGELTGRPDLLDIGALPTRPGEPQRLVADVRRLRDEVGFTSRHTLRDGLADAIEWWRTA
ncbi:MAG: NAD-dependent epimerase/dehydratase family protein [Solirubrobacterales bacterium]